MSAPEKMDTSPSDPGLLCFESLDRKSPDIWPEQVPGVSTFTPKELSEFPPALQKQCTTQLTKDDLKQLTDLGHLTADQLMDHIKYLQNSAYRLGILEARELARGKFLRILELSEEH